MGHFLVSTKQVSAFKTQACHCSQARVLPGNTRSLMVLAATQAKGLFTWYFTDRHELLLPILQDNKKL